MNWKCWVYICAYYYFFYSGFALLLLLFELCNTICQLLQWRDEICLWFWRKRDIYRASNEPQNCHYIYIFSWCLHSPEELKYFYTSPRISFVHLHIVLNFYYFIHINFNQKFRQSSIERNLVAEYIMERIK